MQQNVSSLSSPDGGQEELAENAAADDASSYVDSAIQVSLELCERMAAGLAHDLNNAFQAVLGPLWELEELLAELPAATPHILRLGEACKRGIALARLQSECFSTGGNSLASVAAVLEETKPLLRHLLGITNPLRLHIAPKAGSLLANRRVFRRLLLHLAWSLGTRLELAAVVEISLQPVPPSTSGLVRQNARDGTAPSAFCLLLAARPAGPSTASPQPSVSLSQDRPLAVTSIEQTLAAQLGARLRTTANAVLLAYELELPAAATPAED